MAVFQIDNFKKTGIFSEIGAISSVRSIDERRTAGGKALPLSLSITLITFNLKNNTEQLDIKLHCN